MRVLLRSIHMLPGLLDLISDRALLTRSACWRLPGSCPPVDSVDEAVFFFFFFWRWNARTR